MKLIPILAAKLIASAYGYDQVIILARKVGPAGGEQMTTYGATKAHCDAAAKIGRAMQTKMGWNDDHDKPPN